MRWINPYAVVAGVVNRFPRAVLAVMVALAIVAIVFMGAIPSYTISDEYMDKSAPAGVVFDTYSNRYMQDTYILLIHAGISRTRSSFPTSSFSKSRSAVSMRSVRRPPLRTWLHSSTAG